MKRTNVLQASRQSARVARHLNEALVHTSLIPDTVHFETQCEFSLRSRDTPHVTPHGTPVRSDSLHINSSTLMRYVSKLGISPATNDQLVFLDFCMLHGADV